MLQCLNSSKILTPSYREKMLSEIEDPTPIYRVKVIDNLGTEKYAYLEPAQQSDIPSSNSPDFTFAWHDFWQKSDFDCEAIIKFSYQGNILGLIRSGIYPYPFPSNTPEYIEVLHLQCVSKEKRLVNPVGFWLLWYAT